MRVAGSVAIVTGGSRGLGRAFSEELLKRGGKVCLADINETEGLQTEMALNKKYGDSKSMFVKCDVTKDDDVKALWSRALETFKTVDIVVNNAGIMDETRVRDTIEINLMGVIRGTDAAFEYMRRDKGGKGGLIINVASTAGLFPVFFMPNYVASKMGVVGYTRSWAFNPSQQQFGVNFAVLCPAFTQTPMLNVVEERSPPLVTYEQNKMAINSVIKKFGVNAVEEVSSAFIQLVEKEDNNGAVVTIEKKFGPIYRFTKHPFKL